jgi:hypothetical protein
MPIGSMTVRAITAEERKVVAYQGETHRILYPTPGASQSPP